MKNKYPRFLIPLENTWWFYAINVVRIKNEEDFVEIYWKNGGETCYTWRAKDFFINDGWEEISKEEASLII